MVLRVPAPHTRATSHTTYHYHRTSSSPLSHTSPAILMRPPSLVLRLPAIAWRRRRRPKYERYQPSVHICAQRRRWWHLWCWRWRWQRTPCPYNLLSRDIHVTTSALVGFCHLFKRRCSHPQVRSPKIFKDERHESANVASASFASGKSN